MGYKKKHSYFNHDSDPWRRRIMNMPTKHDISWNEAIKAVLEIWDDWDGRGLTCQEFIYKYKLDVEMKTPTLPWLKEAIRRLRKNRQGE